MRWMLLLAFLLNATMGYCAAASEIYVYTKEPILRGKVAEYIIEIDKRVENLSGITFELNGNGSPISVIAENNQSPLILGALLQDQEPVIAGSMGTGDYASLTDTFRYIEETAKFNIIFNRPVTGPGVLFKLRRYIPIGNGNSSFYPLSLRGIYANDKEGKNINLTSLNQNKSFRLNYFGDLNNDRTLTLSDVILILRASVGLDHLTVEQSWYADVDPISNDGYPMLNNRYLGDGKVSVRDAVRLLDYIVSPNTFVWWPDIPSNIRFPKPTVSSGKNRLENDILSQVFNLKSFLSKEHVYSVMSIYSNTYNESYDKQAIEGRLTRAFMAFDVHKYEGFESGVFIPQEDGSVLHSFTHLITLKNKTNGALIPLEYKAVYRWIREGNNWKISSVEHDQSNAFLYAYETLKGAGG